MADAKVMTGKTGYDVVVINAEPFLGQEIKAGAYRTLDRAKIPNLKNLDPELMRILTKADPGNDHAVIYQWGTVGLGYNVDAVAKRIPNAPTNSWALLFDPANASKLKECGINVVDSPAIVVPLALKYLGKDPGSTSSRGSRGGAEAADGDPPVSEDDQRFELDCRHGDRERVPQHRLERRRAAVVQQGA